MPDISDKVAYSVTFSRRVLVGDDLHPEWVTQSTSFFEYRPAEEPYWAASKARLLARLNTSLQSTYAHLDTAYQTFLQRGAWQTYKEQYWSQEEIDKMTQGYNTNLATKRALGVLTPGDDLIDFSCED